MAQQCTQDTRWYGYDINGIFDPTYDLEAAKHAAREQDKANEQWWAEEWHAKQAA